MDNTQTLTEDSLSRKQEDEDARVSPDVMESLSAVEMDAQANEATVVDVHYDGNEITCNAEFDVTIDVELPSGTTKEIHMTVPPLQDWKGSTMARLIAYADANPSDFAENHLKIPITRTEDGITLDESRLPSQEVEPNQYENTKVIVSEYGMDQVNSVMVLWFLAFGVFLTSISDIGFALALFSGIFWVAFNILCTPLLNPTDEVHNVEEMFESIPTE